LFLTLCDVEQIDMYETIYQDVETVEGSVIFEKWFRVDSRPFRQAMLNIVKKWSLMFKQHLIDHVTNRRVRQQHSSGSVVESASFISRCCCDIHIHSLIAAYNTIGYDMQSVNVRPNVARDQIEINENQETRQ